MKLRICFTLKSPKQDPDPETGTASPMQFAVPGGSSLKTLSIGGLC